MNSTVRQFRDFFVSLRLTVVLLGLSIILIFWATLAQVDLGIWAVQEKFFRSFFVLGTIPGTRVPVPIFPGGYFIGILLLFNLLAAHIYRFAWSWRKTGLWLTHAGLILLLVGELITGLIARESQLRLTEGETKNYSESILQRELAVIDTTDPKFDDVVAIPLDVVADNERIQHPKLPFTITVRAYFPNSSLQFRSQTPNAPPSLATVGIGTQVAVEPAPLTYKPDEQNIPSAFLELAGPEGPFGIFLVSTVLADQPDMFSYAGRTWKLALRPTRNYKPFAITLKKFTHDIYPGTQIPKNFASLVHLQADDGSVDRDVRIYMNNPLRYGGFTFYQAGFENNDRTTILQVVKNPGWLLPYFSCIIIGLGLVIQFGQHLVGFIRKRTAVALNAENAKDAKVS